jgi:ELWxxDGT repeat protein
MYDNVTGVASTIWRSDGTVAGTSAFVTGAEFLVASEGKLYFLTRNDEHLWVTNGTSAGTISLTDFPIDYLTCVNRTCYFSESTPSMWATDGTPGGTFKLADIPFDGLSEFVEVTGTVYFTYADQLWKTDNTPAGTLVIMDNLSPKQLTSANGQLFFINSDRQLWKSNGTNAGTMMVTSFEASQKLSEIVIVNGKILLRVEDPPVIPTNDYIGTQDWHLYKSDGTQAGTQWVADFAQTYVQCPTPLCWSGILDPENSTVLEGKWFFEALDNVSYAPKFWVVTDVFFQDAAPDHWAFSWVERLAEAGITEGCSPEHYCPNDPINRAQIAVFLEKGMHYPDAFTPPNVVPTFSDITGHWAEDWIEALRSDGITGGCGTNIYCPDSPVTRAQMAIFLLKSRYGSGFIPPAVGASTGFNDVPTTHWAAAWIKQLAAEGITGGCGTGTYCPDSPVTRAQMAVFLVRTFSLP